jgi:hypothetical protein
LTPLTVQDFVSKLKNHILPRIKEIHRQALASEEALNPLRGGLSAMRALNPDNNSVFFQSDRMYRHHLARFNYTTYDVRRSQDVINPGTSHRDIMILANSADDDSGSSHPFLYARVLGIYHVNVIYTGEGSLDYAARRVEFLWVRWFKYDDNRSMDWSDLTIDRIRFFAMAHEGAFGFVDPKDVLRACHIVPAFARGKAHPDGIGLSKLAQDAEDWSRYHVNRYAQFFLWSDHNLLDI